MSIQLRANPSHVRVANNGATSDTIAQPAATQVGDRLVVVAVTRERSAFTFNTPSGWTGLGKIVQAGDRQHLWMFTREASASGSVAHTFTWTPGQGYYQDVHLWLFAFSEGELVSVQGGSLSASTTAFQLATPATSKPGSYLAAVDGADTGTSGSSHTLAVSGTGWATYTSTSSFPEVSAAASKAAPSNVGPGTVSFGPMGSTSLYHAGVAFVVQPKNQAPNAPTLTTLVGGEVIDRGAANRASHSFSDPDAGDSQSAFDHRYRLVGSPTWTTGYAPTPNQFVDYPAGTFVAGNYERQVRAYDSQGVAGPWSPSGFFTAATAPATPTITDPIQNETIAAEARDVTWSAPSQDAYQLQVLDGGLVEYDTGAAVSTSRTAPAVPYPTNNVTRTTRVRVRYGGLWSDWYAISNPISYTRPPIPSFTLAAAGTGLTVQVTNPAPGAGEPSVVQNDVYVTEGGREERRAIVVPNGSWTYRLPTSGQHYDQLIRIEAIGDNGTRTSS